MRHSLVIMSGFWSNIFVILFVWTGITRWSGNNFLRETRLEAATDISSAIARSVSSAIARPREDGRYLTSRSTLSFSPRVSHQRVVHLTTGQWLDGPPDRSVVNIRNSPGIHTEKIPPNKEISTKFWTNVKDSWPTLTQHYAELTFICS